MDIMTPFRFYTNADYITMNQPNRENVEQVPPLMVENNVIPSFQVAIPFSPGDIAWTFKLYDDDQVEQHDLSSSITIYENLRIVNGVPMRYLVHTRETVSYSSGCYYARLVITGVATFYGVRFSNMTSDYIETFYRKYNNAGDLRIIDGSSNKRLTK